MENTKSNLNLNCSYIGGHITNDPEYKTTGTGIAIANMTIAVNRKYKSGEEWKNEVEFIRVKLFAKLAEVAKTILKKGDTVLITGRIHTSSWDDNNGIKKYMTEIIADNLQKIDPKIDFATGKKETEEEIEAVEDNNEKNTRDIPF